MPNFESLTFTTFWNEIEERMNINMQKTQAMSIIHTELYTCGESYGNKQSFECEICYPAEYIHNFGISGEKAIKSGQA